MLLQQQYRERRFIKYSELITCFLVAEQNNELLLKKITNLALPNLYHCLKPMPQFKLIDVGVGMGVNIFMDEAEAVVVVAIFLGIKVILINLTIRKTTSRTRS